MKPSDPQASADNTPPIVEVPDYRPVERFWPYVDLPEQPTDEELAQLDPALAEALFGTPPAAVLGVAGVLAVRRPGLRARPGDGPRRRRAPRVRQRARAVRYRARFYPQDALQLRNLFDIVGRFDATDVLIDDRPVPYARELWLPLLWFLIR